MVLLPAVAEVRGPTEDRLRGPKLFDFEAIDASAIRRLARSGYVRFRPSAPSQRQTVITVIPSLGSLHQLNSLTSRF